MEIVDNLVRTQNQALAYFDLADTYHYLTYQEGKWNIRQLLCHIADAETVLYDRVRRIISEPKQVIWAFDQDLWAKNLGYENFPLNVSKQIFNSVRNGMIFLAQQHYEPLGNKQFIHSETGARTLKEEFNKVAWHCEHHLHQIEKAIKTK